MHEHRTPDGKTIYYMSRAELERLPGHRGHGDKYRAKCPIHGGDSFQAFTINYATGWGHCFKCGDEWSLRVEDHPDTILPARHPAYTPKKGTSRPVQLDTAAQSHQKPQTRAYKAVESPVRDDTPENDPVSISRVIERLQAHIPAAMDALAGSPGAAYLESRGIDLNIARALRIGWSTRGDLANRVIFPLTGPDGVPIGATGRMLPGGRNPKYKALAAGKGYRPALFNGGVIPYAIRTNHPLLIVEGPLDAAAAYAAGYPLTVAICSTSFKQWEYFTGVQRAILLLDNDPAGVEARGRAYAALQGYIPDVKVLTPAALEAVLEGAGDLGDYWQQHRRIPPILGAMITGPHMPGTMKKHETPRGGDDPRNGVTRGGVNGVTRGGVNSPVSEIDHGDAMPAEKHPLMEADTPHGNGLGNDHPIEASTPHRSTPENRNPIVANTPHSSDTPMNAWNPHGSPATGNAMQSGQCHAIDSIELTEQAVRDLFPRLETGLQLEAVELLVRLQDRDFAKAFRADFYDAYTVLDTADRVACLWALIYHPADALQRWRALLRAA